ncbi:ribosomal-protein-alanine N-acetyltransferase [Hartmannibacter diazotrophicus]|uniref:Ribosomal-protein-alanine N-acetyltransferase n=1 Tax=Hartmannibacter diazotrophicus TaxID=1482074 RepID=A0A2C9D2K0_9HYPH|nr:N-acetyltransferase [Hartmannibacter diazotrophicus]SON54409.1 ribosomal-protein-alanine N-acetyltransferase [Hartmannibacter diazotrophicus]
MTFDIRPALVADLDTVVDITRRAYDVYLPILGYPPVPVTEDYAPRIARGEVWLGLEDGAIAALIVIERDVDHDMIFSVAVDPDHAGYGYGRRLIDFAEERARDAGRATIRLYTNALMTRNIALYKRLGFEETGRRPNPKRPVFTIVDMTKRL